NPGEAELGPDNPGEAELGPDNPARAGADRPLSAAADAQHVFSLWTAYLRHEKRFSPHTLRAYLADLRHFFDFATRHLGRPPSLNDLGNLGIRDFRSWLTL